MCNVYKCTIKKHYTIVDPILLDFIISVFSYLNVTFVVTFLVSYSRGHSAETILTVFFEI